MGQVVPFIARVRDSGDWSAAERARLEALAERLAASGVRVEVIFGATDEGDPWCVVTDADGDVLIHVARINGKFVVHSAVDDAVNESADLHTALRDRLEATEEAMAPQSATILPFGQTARQGQTFLALLAAAAFFYETAAIGDTAEAGEKIQALPPPNDDPPPDADAPAQEREATQGVALQPATTPSTPQLAPTPAAAPVAAPEPPAPPPAIEAQAPAPAAKSDALAAPPAEEARFVIQGTAGNDLLVGTSADEHIMGGDGNDTLRGGGGNDLLEGGAGDDVIEVTGQVTAVGGEGADTFVLATPVQAGPERLLGVILDFSALQGDRIFNVAGEAVRFRQPPSTDTDHKGPPDDGDGGFTTTLVPPHPETDPLAPPTGGGDVSTTMVGRPPLTRVEVDLDGDGVVDGYILVGVRAIVTTVGASFGPTDLVG